MINIPVKVGCTFSNEATLQVIMVRWTYFDYKLKNQIHQMKINQTAQSVVS